ncbi:hypothetical protein BO83DRAFT_433277 [Aspergillus eucalypticola CBS 122712]|uniref:Uncharacterized protein n=1 Tax=Aspergillus eucalypticola (strain CBS 122712 / IBT 29274) TaxID=1448314 RepID=A0A317WI46_ASPEC|nr:uncharacterized protein BO83DRAFT_433277 [Aspergillus eucalypticola CBS 122712]PWY85331.1 hypothetical protein BO83DRAFT_433277 [Aspergillus eucalypticola CBS 122712]
MTLKPLTSSIHIKTHPAPRSLSESKLILSALQKFGEVVTFRNLKYDPTNTSPKSAHNTIAIFESAAAASSAIAASPITIPVQSQTQTLTQSQSQSLEGRDESPSHTATHSTPSPSPSQPQGPTLTCTIQPSRHNHVSAMTRNPYHTFFYVDKDSHMYKDLVKSGIPLDYLADGPMRRKAHVPERVKRMLDRDVWRFGGKSLMGLYRFGVESEGESGNGMEGQGEKERKDGEGEGEGTK